MFSEKESSSSCLWPSLFVPLSKQLCFSWLKELHTKSCCTFPSTPRSTWLPNGHTIFAAFLGLSTVSCPGISITALPYRSLMPWLAAAISKLKYNRIAFSSSVALLICRKESKKTNKLPSVLVIQGLLNQNGYYEHMSVAVQSTLVLADTFGTSFCVQNSESP